jgi:hypothetical protein
MTSLLNPRELPYACWACWRSALCQLQIRAALQTLYTGCSKFNARVRTLTVGLLPHQTGQILGPA